MYQYIANHQIDNNNTIMVLSDYVVYFFKTDDYGYKTKQDFLNNNYKKDLYFIFDNKENLFVGIVTYNDYIVIRYQGYFDKTNPIYENGKIIENERFSCIPINTNIEIAMSDFLSL